MRNNTKTSTIEITTRILMSFAQAWLMGGGLVAALLGLQQIVLGNTPYGLGCLLIGGAVLASGWFMRNELSQAPAARPRWPHSVSGLRRSM